MQRRLISLLTGLLLIATPLSAQTDAPQSRWGIGVNYFGSSVSSMGPYTWTDRYLGPTPLLFRYRIFTRFDIEVGIDFEKQTTRHFTPEESKTTDCSMGLSLGLFRSYLLRGNAGYFGIRVGVLGNQDGYDVHYFTSIQDYDWLAHYGQLITGTEIIQYEHFALSIETVCQYLVFVRSLPIHPRIRLAGAPGKSSIRLGTNLLFYYYF